MQITVNLPALFARFTGGKQTIDAEGETVSDVLQGVARHYPDLAPRLHNAFAAHPFVTVYVNDTNIRDRGGLDVRLREGDEIVVVAAVAGG